MKVISKFQTLLFLSCMFLIIITGCKKDETGYYQLITTYNVTTTLSFSIDSIHDNRCLSCITGGDCELFFTINNNDVSTDTLIYFGSNNNNPFDLEGFTWLITDILPTKDIGQTIEDSEYRFYMTITEN